MVPSGMVPYYVVLVGIDEYPIVGYERIPSPYTQSRTDRN